MSARRATPWLAILLLLAVAHLGMTCDPTSPPPPDHWLQVEVENVYPAGAGYFLETSVFVHTDAPFQAIDLSVDWQGEDLTVRPILHADFDDDGVPFGPPLPIGVATGPIALRDVRHDTPAPSGGVCVAQLWLYAPNGGEVTVDASGVVGRPDGTTATLASGAITHTP